AMPPALSKTYTSAIVSRFMRAITMESCKPRKSKSAQLRPRSETTTPLERNKHERHKLDPRFHRGYFPAPDISHRDGHDFRIDSRADSRSAAPPGSRCASQSPIDKFELGNDRRHRRSRRVSGELGANRKL